MDNVKNLTNMTTMTDMNDMTDVQLKKSEKVILTVLFSLMAMILVLTFVSTATEQNGPTVLTSAEAFSNVKSRVETVNTMELSIAKKMFEQAIEDGGHRVDDSVVHIWSDDGMDTMSFYWKCGDQYYCTQVRGRDQYYPYKEVVYVLGWHHGGRIQSVKYQNGYLIVDSDIEV